MLLAPVAERSGLAGTLDVLQRDPWHGARLRRRRRGPGATTGEGHRHLEGREHGSGVSFDEVDEPGDGCRVGLEPLDAKRTLGELSEILAASEPRSATASTG